MAIWEKLFSKIIFKDYPNTSTPVNAYNLNKISDAIDGIDDRVIELKTDSEGIDISDDINILNGTIVFMDIYKIGNYIDLTIRLEGVTSNDGFTALFSMKNYKSTNVNYLNGYNNTTKTIITALTSEQYVAINQATSNATITISGRFRVNEN